MHSNYRRHAFSKNAGGRVVAAGKRELVRTGQPAPTVTRSDRPNNSFLATAYSDEFSVSIHFWGEQGLVHVLDGSVLIKYTGARSRTGSRVTLELLVAASLAWEIYCAWQPSRRTAILLFVMFKHPTRMLCFQWLAVACNNTDCRFWPRFANAAAVGTANQPATRILQVCVVDNGCTHIRAWRGRLECRCV